MHPYIFLKKPAPLFYIYTETYTLMQPNVLIQLKDNNILGSQSYMR